MRLTVFAVAAAALAVPHTFQSLQAQDSSTGPAGVFVGETSSSYGPFIPNPSFEQPDYGLNGLCYKEAAYMWSYYAPGFDYNHCGLARFDVGPHAAGSLDNRQAAYLYVNPEKQNQHSSMASFISGLTLGEDYILSYFDGATPNNTINATYSYRIFDPADPNGNPLAEGTINVGPPPGFWVERKIAFTASASPLEFTFTAGEFGQNGSYHIAFDAFNIIASNNTVSSLDNTACAAINYYYSFDGNASIMFDAGNTVTAVRLFTQVQTNYTNGQSSQWSIYSSDMLQQPNGAFQFNLATDLPVSGSNRPRFSTTPIDGSVDSVRSYMFDYTAVSGVICHSVIYDNSIVKLREPTTATSSTGATENSTSASTTSSENTTSTGEASSTTNSTTGTTSTNYTAATGESSGSSTAEAAANFSSSTGESSAVTNATGNVETSTSTSNNTAGEISSSTGTAENTTTTSTGSTANETVSSTGEASSISGTSTGTTVTNSSGGGSANFTSESSTAGFTANYASSSTGGANNATSASGSVESSGEAVETSTANNNNSTVTENSSSEAATESSAASTPESSTAAEKSSANTPASATSISTPASESSESVPSESSVSMASESSQLNSATSIIAIAPITTTPSTSSSAGQAATSTSTAEQTPASEASSAEQSPSEQSSTAEEMPASPSSTASQPQPQPTAEQASTAQQTPASQASTAEQTPATESSTASLPPAGEGSTASQATTSSSTGSQNASGQQGNPNPTGPQTSPASGVCPAIQFTQTPTNTDVTFQGLTTRNIQWINVHINVLEQGQGPYPLNAPVENNSWFWNYRMEKTGDKTFHFTYTTGPNGFNFKPQTQRLQYFFTYGLDLFACNTQSFVYTPNGQPSTGAFTTTIPTATRDETPVYQSPGSGACPALNFSYTVVASGQHYEIRFTPLTERNVSFVDVHLNVLQPGQTPYPANAIVEANNWRWNLRMQQTGNKFKFQLTDGPNGINYQPSQTLQFFFTYCTEETDCNTQSFVYNPQSGSMPSPNAGQPSGTNQSSSGTNQSPSGTNQSPSNSPVTAPANNANLTFCEYYAQQLFGAAQSNCYQTALFALIGRRVAYGGPNVNGIFVPGSPVYNLFQTTIPYNGQQIDLSQYLNNTHYIAQAQQTLVELSGRLLGCKSQQFPDFQSNPDYANSSYQYPDINTIRNTVKGLNLPQSLFDYVNDAIYSSLRSFGVNEADIQNTVKPAIEGFEAGLAGQPTVNTQQTRASDSANSAAQPLTFNTLALALPAFAALLF